MLLGSLAVACSGSEPPTDTVPTPSPTPATSSPALPHRGGLVGAIDSARLAALCENVRLALTALEGGLPNSTVAGSLDAALSSLRQPPADADVRATAAHWVRVRHQAGDAATVRRLAAFCDRESG